MSAHQLRIDSVMSRTVVTIDIAATVGQAARQIAAQLVSCVIVVENGQPVGVITERDIAVCAAADHALDGITAGEVMGSPLVTVQSSDTLAHVMRQVAEQGIRHAPVLDKKGTLVGLITQSDLLRACGELAGVLPKRS